MASHIWLGGLKPQQDRVPDPTRSTEDSKWHGVLGAFRGRGNQAIIAKGNSIEGIEAKE